MAYQALNKRKGFGRGRTRAGRLERLDQWLVLSGTLPESGPLVVADIGLGDLPLTTVELHARLLRHYPHAHVIGVDHCAQRVRAATPFSQAGLEFHEGGFDLSTLGYRPYLVRAFNILRGYPLAEVLPAYQALGRSLCDGGWLIEGNSSTDGHVAVALLMQRKGNTLLRRALWFHAAGERGFSPVMLRNYLPRELRKTARNGHPLGVFFSHWLSCWEKNRRNGDGSFAASVRELRQLAEVSWERPGVALWRPVQGVPAHDGSLGAIALRS